MLPYEEEVRGLLCEVLGLEEIGQVGADEDLQAIGFDSLNFIKLVIAIEDRYELEFPEEKLGLQFVRNIHDICSLIEEFSAARAG